jgi:imidazole glycerol-phosphate synthase subunit HisF
MFRPRLIPVLLLKNKGLVKSKKFGDHRYIGDPLNAVRLFNELKADELLFLDIEAWKKQGVISIELLRAIAEEAEMAFGAGGGISNLQQIREIIAVGAEKVVIGATAAIRPEFIYEAASEFGSSAISVCIDVRKNMWGKERIWIQNGKKAIEAGPIEMAQLMQDKGAGEIIIQSIDRDGMMAGYDLELIKRVSMATSIPVVALGGAGKDSHFREGYLYGMASALAAGSRFIYQGPRNGVLINYPENTAAIFS